MKLNKIQYLFFNGFLILGASSLISSNMMMQLFTSSAYLIPLLVLPIVSILLYFIPNTFSLKTILSSTFSRIILLLYLLLNSYLFVISYLKVTNDYFYNLTPPLIILIIVLCLSLFISLYNVKDIFKIGFVISFISICSFILILLNTIEYDFSLVIHHFSLDHNYLFLSCFLFIYLDVLINQIFIVDHQTKRKDFFILFVIIAIINAILIFKNYLFFNYEFFIQAKFPYIYKYLVYSNKLIFEHLDILYLVFITIFFVFKIALSIEYSRIILKIKKNSPILLIFIITLVTLSLISNLLDIGLEIISYLMICASCLLILFFITLKFKKQWRKNE